VNKVIQNNKVVPLTYIIGCALVVSLAGILMGLDTGIIGGSADFIFQTFNITAQHDFVRGIAVAGVPLGALFGAIASAPFSFKFGRRASLLVTSCVGTVGVLTIASAHGMGAVVIGRLFMGFAVGLSAMTGPMYLAEISPCEVRGAMVFLFQLAITIGILLAYLINYVYSGSGDWRAMFILCLIPVILLGLGVLFLPRSPRWLMQKRRESEAVKVLQKIRQSTDVSSELADIKDSITHTRVPLRHLFSKHFLPLLLIAFGLFLFQQLSGINTIFYYVETVFREAGFNVQNAILASLPAAGVNVIATVAAIWLIDSCGRRKVLLSGMFGAVICLLVLSLAYYHVFSAAYSGIIVLVAVLTFIACFAVSLGGIPYIIMSEIFPLNARHLGMSAASFANWGFNALVSFTYLWFLDTIGPGSTYLMYTIFTVIGFVLMFIFLPETKGCKLEEIERHLYEGKPLRHLGKAQNK